MTLSVRAHVGKNKNKRRGLKHHHGGSNADVNHETDARFWAQTGYKPGTSLDLKDPSDRAMSKVWLDIFGRVSREDEMGQLQRTFDDPTVADHLEHAKKAHLAAMNHMIGAQAATDETHLEAHLRAAKDANTISRESCEAAAKFQPQSVTQAVLDQARAEVSQTAPRDSNEVADVVSKGEEEQAKVPGTDLPVADSPMAPTPNMMLAPENDPWDERYKGPAPMQADSPPPPAPDTTPPMQADNPQPAPPQPGQQPDPGKHGRHPKQGGTTPPPAPPPQAQQPAPPPAPPGQPGWVDYTGQPPTRDPGPPMTPTRQQSGSPRGRAIERRKTQPWVVNDANRGEGGGPSAGQVALGVGAVGLFFGMVAFFRGRS